MYEEPIIAKTSEETDRKCPSCGATADYDPATGMLLCPYCGTSQQITTESDTSAEELDFDTAEATGNFNWGVETKTVVCKNCGASTVYDSMSTSGECPYCGSNQVIQQENTANMMAPGGVCPFKVSKENAGTNFKAWLGKKIFCPSLAKQKAKPDEFNGIYLPYWTFDSQTYTEYSAQYGIDHTHRDSNGNTHTTTDWHRTSGAYSQFIDDELVVASSQQNSVILKRIEPFNTADNITYKPEYLAGFGSERYSIGLKDAWELAKNSISAKLKKAISEKVEHEKHADHVNNIVMNINYSDIKYKYLLLPVWMSCFEYNGKVYQFMVNGQTGKVGGKAPVSPLRVCIACAIGLVVLAAVGIYIYMS